MKRILIIEDEAIIAELEKDYLEVAGYTVDIDYSGETGLQRILLKDYDLLILDIMLRIDGYEICKQVRLKRTYQYLWCPQNKRKSIKLKG